MTPSGKRVRMRMCGSGKQTYIPDEKLVPPMDTNLPIVSHATFRNSRLTWSERNILIKD